MDGRRCSPDYNKQDPGRCTEHIHFHEGLVGETHRGIYAAYSIDNSKVSMEANEKHAQILRVIVIKEASLTIYLFAVRPSIILPVWKEPLPGWTDNINGPIGLLIAAGKGVLRTMYCDGDSYGDFIPVDIAVNAILIITLNYLYFNDHEKRVYNLTTSNEFKVRKSNHSLRI